MSIDKSKLFFVIWTTTIWTLPGNLAIALHPDESYALVKAPNGEVYILAEALVKKVMEVGRIEGYEIVATHPGSFFENMLADHPFLPKTSRLVLADYVTMDSGTGCVHTAPGFGADDYETCKRYGMDMVVPVDDQGRHTDYAGKYAGLKTEESNPIILADMKESGALFASEEIVHSYPHCWRCKKPIIFRATPQWFCSVETFKDAACEACDEVRWVPAWGLDRMKAMVRERADWCISRQRRWGLPIPVFYCNDCGKPIVHRRDHRSSSATCSAPKAPTPGLTKDAAEHPARRLHLPPLRQVQWLHQGGGHPGRLVRLRLHPLRLHEEGPGLLAGRRLPGRSGPVPRLVPGGPADRRRRHWAWPGPLQGRASPTAGPWTARARPCTSPWATAWTPMTSSTSTAQTSSVCGPPPPTTTRTCAAPTTIFKQLSQNYLKFRNTARYCLGNLDGFDPDNLVAPADMLELDQLGHHPPQRPDREVLRRPMTTTSSTSSPTP